MGRKLEQFRGDFKSPYFVRWLEEMYRKITDITAIFWSQIDMTGSSLADLETKDHAMLESIEGWTAGIDTVQDKHISEADGKTWQDHVELIDDNPHGTDWDMLEGTINHLPMEPNPVSVPDIEGTVFWDKTNHVLAFKPDVPGNILQIGLESWVRVKNMTGSTLLDGSAVVSNGVSGGILTIAPALAVPGPLARTTAICNHDILDGEEGFVTIRGNVNNIDTSSYTPFIALYVSATVAGALTNTPPISPNYAIPIGYALNSQVDGSIYVNSYNPANIIKNTDASTASQDPTGFNYNDSITSTYDSTARTITLTGNLQYSWRGSVLSLASPWTSPAHSSTTGVSYFLYSSDGVNFTWSTTVWVFSDIQIAYVYYGATNKFATREVHGLMGWQTHEELHTIVGTYKQSGGALSSYVIGSTIVGDRRISVASTVIKDEDCRTTNAALTSDLFTQIYLTSTGVNTFAVDQAEIVPVSGNNPYYNQFVTPDWVQTLMAVSSYMSIWLVGVPATADAGSQKYRFLWLQGQTNGTLSVEQSLTPASLELDGLRSLFSEFCFFSQIIIRYIGGNWEITQVKDLTRRVAA